VAAVLYGLSALSVNNLYNIGKRELSVLRVATR